MLDTVPILDYLFIKSNIFVGFMKALWFEDNPMLDWWTSHHKNELMFDQPISWNRFIWVVQKLEVAVSNIQLVNVVYRKTKIWLSLKEWNTQYIDQA
jgi:hypothetical protein